MHSVCHSFNYIFEMKKYRFSLDLIYVTFNALIWENWLDLVAILLFN